ncbi:MAG: helix-turn-helix transcriptional regulator [Cyanobacteria bacterium]|nr:helix-turn-helix transcriptional regulator [Cyanobacteriota bacterium]
MVSAVCAEVRERRRDLNISQGELARRSGLDRSYITDLEKRTHNLSIKNLSRLAEALNMTVAELFSLAERSVKSPEEQD